MSSDDDLRPTLERLEGDLADIARRVEGVRTGLGTLRRAGGVATATSTPAPPPGPAAPGPVRPPRPPANRDGRTPIPTARLLGIAGGVVTLLGVVLLLVLAANRGWFGPEARVLAGAVVGVVLVGSGLRVRRGSRADRAARPGSDPVPGADPGPAALVGTGVAALYLSVAAAASLDDLLAVPVALLLALLVVGGGLVLADRWRSAGLALGVVLGGDALVPFVVGHPTPLLVAFLLVVAAAAVAGDTRRAWVGPGLAAGVATALGALAAGVLFAVTGTRTATTITVDVLVVLAGLVTALVDARRPARSRRGAVARLAVLVGGPVPGVLVVAPALPRAGGAVLALALAAGLGLAALAVATRALPRPVRPAVPLAGPLAAALAAVAAVLAVVGTSLALRGAAQGGALLAEALVLAVLAARTGRRGLLLAATPFGLVGLVPALARDLPPVLLVDGAGPLTVASLSGALVVAVLLTATAVATLVASRRCGLLEGGEATARVAGALGLVGLYGTSGVLVPGALLVEPTRDGFVVGHVLVTVSWTLLALVLLLRGVRVPLLRVVGGVLVVVALTKLLLFDLTALDGLARVLAFLGAGVVLLAAGTRYARSLARAVGQADPVGADGPEPAGPDGTLRA